MESHESTTDLVRSSSAEIGYDRGEAMAVAARLSGVLAVPSTEEFDPAKSYGQTRTAFESEFEQRYVAWLLNRHSGNISAAAREARMDRKHLHDLAKKHGLRGRGTSTRR